MIAPLEEGREAELEMIAPPDDDRGAAELEMIAPLEPDEVAEPER